MTFEIKTIQHNEALEIIDATRTRYQEFYEGIIDNNAYEGQYLQELLQLEKQEPGNHKETIALQSEVFKKGEQSALNFKQKIQRMDHITAQKNNPSFFISKDTNKTEIKTLMAEIDLALSKTTDPAEIQFLTTVSETAETCKDNISNGVAFDDQYIPLLANEQKYARILITDVTHKKLDTLIQDPATDSNFLSTIKEVYNQAVNSKNTLGLMDKEQDFMKAVQAEIEHVINASSPSSQDTSQRLHEALHAKIDTLLTNDSQKNNFFSDAFKKFINHVCKAINIVSPFAHAAEAKKDIIQMFEDMKQTLQDTIPPQAEIEEMKEADQSEENNPEGPAA